MKYLMLDPIGSLVNELIDSELDWPFSARKVQPVKFSSAEDSENYYVRAELPGFNEQELNVSTRGNRITISGKHEIKEESEVDNLFRSTMSSFEKTYILPQDIISDSVRAEYKSGILVVTLQKRKSTAPELKSIPIKSLSA